MSRVGVLPIATRSSAEGPAATRGGASTVSETVHAVIKVLLKVTDKEDYSWVECGSCAAG